MRAGAHELDPTPKRVLDIDVELCPNCSGTLKIITAIEDPPVLEKSSAISVYRPAPPRAPKRQVDLFQTSEQPKSLPTHHKEPFTRLATALRAEPAVQQ